MFSFVLNPNISLFIDKLHYPNISYFYVIVKCSTCQLNGDKVDEKGLNQLRGAIEKIPRQLKGFNPIEIVRSVNSGYCSA